MLRDVSATGEPEDLIEPLNGEEEEEEENCMAKWGK